MRHGAKKPKPTMINGMPQATTPCQHGGEALPRGSTVHHSQERLPVLCVLGVGAAVGTAFKGSETKEVDSKPSRLDFISFLE